MCCNVVAQEIDGEALFGAVGCQVGLDCLKDILPKFGQPIKVYRAIKAEMEKTNLQQVCKRNPFEGKFVLTHGHFCAAC